MPLHARPLTTAITTLITAATLVGSAHADTLRVYGNRLNDANDPLLTGFTVQSGITVELVQLPPDVFDTSLAGGSPAADVMMIVDSASLARYGAMDVLAPFALEGSLAQVPDFLRDPDQRWVSYATRARLIYANSAYEKPLPNRYQDLAAPNYRGQLCVGSSQSPYNLSLMTSILVNEGEDAARAWAQGIVANLAQPAGGRDSELLQLVAEGNNCQITLANHYYYMRLLSSEESPQQQIAANLMPIWPEQGENQRGTYQNVAAFAMLKGSHQPSVTQAFLEYVVSEQVQQQVADGLFFPVVGTATPAQVTQRMGEARLDQTPIHQLGAHAEHARQMLLDAGWE